MHCIIISKFYGRQKLYMYEFKFVLFWYISKETKKIAFHASSTFKNWKLCDWDESNIDNIRAKGLI